MFYFVPVSVIQGDLFMIGTKPLEMDEKIKMFTAEHNSDCPLLFFKGFGSRSEFLINFPIHISEN